MLVSSATLRQRLLEGRKLLGDGAIGTELIALNVSPDEILLQNCVAPDRVRFLHQRYLHAGVDLITTNTFGLRQDGYWHKAVEAGVSHALQCAQLTERPVGVMLSLISSLVPLEIDFIGELIERHKSDIAIILLETNTDITQAVRAVSKLRSLWNGLIAVTSHFDVRLRMLDGTSVEEAVTILNANDVDILGANCGDALDLFPEIASLMRQRTRKWLLFQPGTGIKRQDRTPESVAPQDFVRVGIQLYENGADIVGGCCGIGPRHIELLYQTYFYSKGGR
ncbi:homocysteine S-methyltransferase family protein [Chthonomonas calidirosea]|uniref:Homocysteine S-methyltransferase n=1 Tax=Chthonomonas calidirosea (strain DSM 23976 / ICMP 18418 / T49) TaxID=1303518 RepID=S0EV76_CHTCT|nr:homocysteine S-methyltransferase family protein [Chthonomonas calidirosea]CCW34252.1 homocysteine S-methyltransferase [Chthonomonas calidirosea T49]CEK14144.1 homocysteine S-methyltransferase [Chthonomonas calidirosea]CEK15316.1 homocysteine S-methyltransferase [Chthonomonas calidirosea]